MNKTTITVGGVTYAIKLRKILSREGIDSELVKISDKEKRGCTHGVRIDRSDFFSVIGIMRKAGIEYGVTDEA